MTVYKEILDTIEWEKKEGRTLSPREIVRTPAARKRLLIGASAGPFSCVAGNIIASYYLNIELESAGIVDSNQQLKAVRVTLLAHLVFLTDSSSILVYSMFIFDLVFFFFVHFLCHWLEDM